MSPFDCSLCKPFFQLEHGVLMEYFANHNQTHNYQTTNQSRRWDRESKLKSYSEFWVGGGAEGIFVGGEL